MTQDAITETLAKGHEEILWLDGIQRDLWFEFTANQVIHMEAFLLLDFFFSSFFFLGGIVYTLTS